MPPLKEAFADFKGFAPGEKRVARMFQLLQEMIQRHRKAVPQRFYSTRDVAEFFAVSLYTVGTVFHRLDQEGLLTRMRSSQTMIPARAPRTRFRVRGVVAMPIWMPGFLQFLDWREWFAIVEEELSRHRFVAEPVFFKGMESVSPAFPERVLKFNPDYILWFGPGKSDTNPMLTFKDAGVPLITINAHRDHHPTRTYPISCEKAYQQGVREWQESGEIDRIALAQSDAGATDRGDLALALQSCLLPLQVMAPPSRSHDLQKAGYPAYLASLTAQPRTGIMFNDVLFFTHLCLCVPDAVMELFRTHRVMVQHRVLTPGTLPKNYTADGVFFPWRGLARRIANDLDQAKGAIATVQPVFQAEWSPRMPLAEVFQAYPNE